LAGNREAACATLLQHLDHEQMRGWYAFDEGGKSGPGGWRFARTTWNSSVAMPHGWAIAEMWLLMRDCLVFEDGRRLVLLAGVPEEWFTHKDGMAVENLQTHFGPLSFRYAPAPGGATLTLGGKADPPDGFLLRLPASMTAKATCEGKAVDRLANGDLSLPRGAKTVRIAPGD
jgi:hypothetical protein